MTSWIGSKLTVSNFSVFSESECLPDDFITEEISSPILTNNQSGANTTLGTTGYFLDYHTTASALLGRGQTFIDVFDEDRFAHLRRQNLYYPFTSRCDWELASFLHGSGLSMASINEFLSLQMVRTT